MTATVMPTTGSSSKASEPYPWILHPVIDLLMVCGGLTAVLLALIMIFPHTFVKGSNVCFSITVASLVIFSMPHGIASYLRVYNSRNKALVKPVTLLAVAVAVACFAGLVWPLAFAIMARVTYFFGIQHLLKQSYGISLLYCYKRKFFFSKWEQKAFLLIAQTALLQSMAILLSRSDALIAGFPLGPAWLPLWTVPVADGIFFASLALFVGVCLRKYIKEKKVMPWPAALCMFITLVIGGSLRITGVDAIVLAFLTAPNFHLTQYVVVTTAYHLKDIGLPENVPANQIASQLIKPVALKYFSFLFGAGFITSILIIPSVWKVGMLFGFTGPAVAAAVFMAINLHHYFTDAMIWRQRDPEVRKLLVA